MLNTTFRQGAIPRIFFTLQYDLSVMENETIFFSYARDDAEFALRLATDLRNAGASIWMDQLDIPVGAHYDNEIHTALKICGSFLVVLTPKAADSKFVNDEIVYALDKGKAIIPVLLKECEMHLRLRRLQFANFTTKYETGFNQLLRSLKLEKAASPAVDASAGVKIEPVKNEPAGKTNTPKANTKSKEHTQGVLNALNTIKAKNAPPKTTKPARQSQPAKPTASVKTPKPKTAEVKPPTTREARNLLSFDQVTIAEWIIQNKTVDRQSYGTLIVHERTLQFKSDDGKVNRVFPGILSIKYLPTKQYPELLDNYMLVTYMPAGSDVKKEVLFTRFAFFINMPTFNMQNQVKQLIRSKVFFLSN